ncbi:hypothetical protein BCR35DRAFT_304501, partial [Leucosporidium creatinivorum]
MSSNRHETRKALASKQDELNLQQPEAAADQSNTKNKSKVTGGSFLDRIKAAPPLVVATESDDEEPPTEPDDGPPAAATRPNHLTEQSALPPSPIVAQLTAARAQQAGASHALSSLGAAPQLPSPSPSSPALPNRSAPLPSSNAALVSAAPLAQHPSSDSDALSYVDIDSDYVAEAPKPTVRDGGDSALNDESQSTKSKKAGARQGPWWSAEGLSPRKDPSTLRSTAQGRDATFTFYEDAPRPVFYGQPAQRTPPRSHPPASHPQPRPSPLRLQQQQEAQRPPRRIPQKSSLSNKEITRAPDPNALLESFRNADEAIKARSRTAPSARRDERAVSVVEETVDDEEQDVAELSEAGEENLPDPAELKQQATSAPRDKNGRARKGKGQEEAQDEDASSDSTNKIKTKSRRQDDPASDSQPDDLDTPPHLAASSRPRRQTRPSATTVKRSTDSTSAPSSDTETEDAPARSKRKSSGKGKSAAAKGKGKGRASKKKASPPVDTESLLALLPRRKRKVEAELTDSGEEPEDEEDDVASDVDEIGYRAKKKRATSSSKSKTNKNSKSRKPKTTGRGKKAAANAEDEEPDSEKERAKQQRLAALNETDAYELDVMMV